MKKLSFLLALVLLFCTASMAACNKKNNPEGTVPSTTPPEATTPEVTTPEAEEPFLDPSLSVLVKDIPNYEIVVAKNSSEEADKLAKELQQAIQGALDLPISLKTANAYNNGQYEILIGETNREETETFLSHLRWKDYGYGMIGEKLVIAGKNEDGTLEALRAFIEYVNAFDGENVFFDNANLYLVTDTSYPFPNLTINGIAAKQLSILCNEESLGGVAQIIRDAIIEASGIPVSIVTDKEIDVLENAIIVGDTSFIDIEAVPDEIAYPTGREYYIDTSWGCIWLRAKTAAGYYSAATKIVAQFSGKGGDNVVITNGDGKGEDAIAVMSFNLMAGIQSGDKRADRVIQTILKYRPAVIGVQEATDTWIALLKQRLGDIYTVVGVGRNADGGDEHSAILYLIEEFDCIESGTKWLSDTPDVAGSKFAESHYTRIMTYAHLARKSDGKQFLHVNTHLDYGTTNEEEQVKVEQMQVMFDQIQKFSADFIIITGDFNATVGSPVYQLITGKGYKDSCHGTAFEEPTYHGLMGTTGAPSHIDFIFHNSIYHSKYDTYYLSNMYYRICTERVDNENVSDHYPIFAILALKPNEK